MCRAPDECQGALHWRVLTFPTAAARRARPTRRVARSRGLSAARDPGSPPVRLVRPRRVGKLLVERLPIAQAAAQELRPRRDDGERIRALGAEPPELRMVPAERVTAAVAVRADAVAEALRLGDELVVGHQGEIVVHRMIRVMRRTLLLARVVRALEVCANIVQVEPRRAELPAREERCLVGEMRRPWIAGGAEGMHGGGAHALPELDDRNVRVAGHGVLACLLR